MRTECSIVRDLLPLYVENMVSGESAEYIEEHLKDCDECSAELELLRGGAESCGSEQTVAHKEDKAKPFKRIMKKMNRQFGMLAYSLVIFFVFLGFSWTGGENLMYNSLIMPIVGVFGYCVFGWRAVYKMPVLLLIIDAFVCLFGLVELELTEVLVWTGIYSIFVFVGIAIAFLLHYAFRKENDR